MTNPLAQRGWLTNEHTIDNFLTWLPEVMLQLLVEDIATMDSSTFSAEFTKLKNVYRSIQRENFTEDKFNEFILSSFQGLRIGVTITAEWRERAPAVCQAVNNPAFTNKVFGICLEEAFCNHYLQVNQQFTEAHMQRFLEPWIEKRVNQHITSLKLGNHDTKLTQNAFRFLISNTPKLEHIDLHCMYDNKGRRTNEDLQLLGQRCPHLRSVDVANQENITGRGIINLTQQCQSLETVAIYGSNSIRSRPDNQLINALSQLPKLSHFYYGYWHGIIAEQLQILRAAHPSITITQRK